MAAANGRRHPQRHIHLVTTTSTPSSSPPSYMQPSKPPCHSRIYLLAWMGWNTNIEGRGLGELCTYDKMFLPSLVSLYYEVAPQCCILLRCKFEGVTNWRIGLPWIRRIELVSFVVFGECSFEDIQMLFDKEMKRVNTFVDMDTKLVKGSETRTKESSKRAGEELESKNLKKQKLDENVEAGRKDMNDSMDTKSEEAEMKKAYRYRFLIDEELIELSKSTHQYSDASNIDRETWKLLKLDKPKHVLTKPEEAYERVLWGDLKVMFEPDVESEVWRNLQGHKVIVWRLFSSSGVHFVMFKICIIFMPVDKADTHLPCNNHINAQQESFKLTTGMKCVIMLLKLMTKRSTKSWKCLNHPS
ncbi:hypothetical protein Tco_1017365 [Tanacetum coccineum]|uniref:Uncharacterized protein n=1 Tax=Tanacetum coccineum TaxID=301880 RepID=A0ABQ5FRA3_9ASTR